MILKKISSLKFFPHETENTHAEAIFFVDINLLLYLLKFNDLSQADLYHADGFYTYLLLRSFNKGICYSSGPEFLKKINVNKAHLFIGGEFNEVKDFIELKKLNAIHLQLPYVKNVNEFKIDSIIEKIISNRIDNCWILISSPKQNHLALILRNELKSRNKKSTIYAVGGALKLITTNKIPYIIRLLRVIWIYRIIKEPKKQVKRIITLISIITGILFKKLFRT